MLAPRPALFLLATCHLLASSGVIGIVQLPLSSPGQAGFPGVLNGPGKTVCYNFSLTDSQVREVVWWTSPRVAFYLEPCAGKPHMKISVYGCPSQGAFAVWDYMSQPMAADLSTQGKPVPPSWEWVGDVESLVLELTHKTYFVEISHFSEPYPSLDGLNTYASFHLQAQIFDVSVMPLEALNPLENFCGWDRTIYSVPRTTLQDRILGGLRVALQVNDTKSEIRWYPPGKGGVKATSCPWEVNVSENFSYQIYIKDITDFVGTSGVEYNIGKAKGVVNPSAYPPGAFADVLKPTLCPTVQPNGQGPCTSYDCRSCPTSYPRCPKQFLSNCTEIAASVLKLKEALNGTERLLC
uniref:Pherophorin domain-containing protein n=1 Tax=Guillardia theta TaxID=55529 RepID=A0A7S4KE26_GUITH|mmetsp:Transcript_23393/g.76017  ORF Transcript_23393/g.76017 Transcript_23393/m.76017 type:complete len:352 (+) Transcript_23393:146-1201(+)